MSSFITNSSGNYISGNGALSVSAINFSLSLPTVNTSGTSLSFSWWGNYNSYSTGTSFFSFAPTSGTNGSIQCKLNNSTTIGLYVYNVTLTPTNPGVTFTAPTAAAWHHYVWVMNGSTWTVYVDNVAVTLTNVNGGPTSPISSTFTNNTIGYHSVLGNAVLGYVDDFRMYSSALSSAQVARIYYNKFQIAYYPLDVSYVGFTPNTAQMIYDASLVGGATITTASGNAAMGTGALQITNATSTASQYMYSAASFPTSASSGLSVAAWVNTSSAAANKVMRVFDLCSSSNNKGISVDISGINTYFSSYRTPITAITQLVLATNAVDIGTSPQTVSTVGTVTYTTVGGKQAAFFQNSTNNYLYLTRTNPTLLTLCYWIYATDTVYSTVVSISNYPSLTNPSFQNDLDTYVRAFVAFPGWWNPAINFVDSTHVNGWVHLAFTFNQSTYLVQMYLNGVLQTSGSGTGAFGKDTSHYILGRAGDGGSSGRGYNGYIRQFCVFDSILTAAQIQSVYTATA